MTSLTFQQLTYVGLNKLNKHKKLLKEVLSQGLIIEQQNC